MKKKIIIMLFIILSLGLFIVSILTFIGSIILDNEVLQNTIIEMDNTESVNETYKNTTEVLDLISMVKENNSSAER